MKTVTLQDDVAGPLNRLHSQGIRLAGRGVTRRLPPAAPAWLPAPRAARCPSQPRATRTHRPEWMVVRQTVSEKVLMGLLAAAALGGIAYGFICLLDLVQNWANVSSGIERML